MRRARSTKVPQVKLKAVPSNLHDSSRAKAKVKTKEAGDDAETERTKIMPECKPLQGKLVCISGYRDIRSNLLRKARELGAEVKTELVTDTTYLISEANEDSAKVKAARENRILIVLASFIEALYEGWSSDEPVAADDILERHSAFPLPKILSGLKISVTHFRLEPPHLRTDVQKLITEHGGEFSSQFSVKVDVLLVGDKSGDWKVDNRKWSLVNNLKGKVEKIPAMVWSDWLFDCVAAQRVLEFADYDAEQSRSMRLKTSAAQDSISSRILQEDTFIADEHNTSLTQKRSLKRSHPVDTTADEPIEPVTVKKRAIDVDDLLLRSSSSTNLRAPPAPAPSRASAEPAGRALTDRHSHDGPDRALARSTTLPASIAQSSPKPIFVGIVFSQKGLPSAFVPKVRNMVQSHGGRFVEDADEPSVNRVLIPWANPPDEVDMNDHRNVSIYWLERCAFQQDVVDHWISTSYNFKSPIDNAESYCIAVSGADTCDAKFVERICTFLKVKMVDKVAEASHCIIFGGGAVKAKHAKELGVPLVGVDWLLNLIKSNSVIRGDPHRRLKRSTEGGPERSVEDVARNSALMGCNIAISSKLSTQRNYIGDLVQELGGQLALPQDTDVTHLLHAGNRVNETARDVKAAKEAGQIICHPSWLEACHKAGFRVDEAAFPHTLAIGRSLAYPAESSAATSLRETFRSPSLQSPSHTTSDKVTQNVIKPESKTPGLLDHPAFAAMPSPPPLHHAVTIISPPDNELPVDLPLPALVMQRSISAPGSLTSSHDSTSAIAALLRKVKPEGSLSTVSSRGEELRSLKARRKERHLSRKRNSAVSVHSADNDEHLFHRLPTTLEDEDLMELDHREGNQAESLLVSYVSTGEEAARQRLQGALSRAKVKTPVS